MYVYQLCCNRRGQQKQKTFLSEKKKNSIIQQIFCSQKIYFLQTEISQEDDTQTGGYKSLNLKIAENQDLNLKIK